MKNKELYTAKEYAEILGISYSTFRRLIKATPDKFAPAKHLGTYPLYYIEDIKQKLAAL